MAKTQIPWPLVGLVLAVLFLGGVISLPAGVVGDGAVDAAPDGGQTSSSLSGTPELIIPVIDKVNGAAHASSMAVLLDGSPIVTKTGTDATPANPEDLNPNATYTLELADVTGNDYLYSRTTPITAPAAAAKTEAVEIYSIAKTLPEITVYKSDDIIANTAAAPQSIGANDQRTMRVRFRLTSGDHNVFSDGVTAPLVVCEFDSDHFTGITMQEAGQVLDATKGVPSGHGTVDLNRSTEATGLFNSNPLKYATNYDLYVTLTSGSTDPVDAADGDADENGAVWCTVYDGARMKKNNTQSYQAAYRNINTPASDVGAGNWEFELQYS